MKNYYLEKFDYEVPGNVLGTIVPILSLWLHENYSALTATLRGEM